MIAASAARLICRRAPLALSGSDLNPDQANRHIEQARTGSAHWSMLMFRDAWFHPAPRQQFQHVERIPPGCNILRLLEGSGCAVHSE